LHAIELRHVERVRVGIKDGDGVAEGAIDEHEELCRVGDDRPVRSRCALSVAAPARL
jgi:hypothetical protein